MTTAAWDGQSLAADTRANSAGFAFQISKAVRLNDGRLYCGSGDADECHAVRLWLEGGGNKPEVKNFVALIIGTDSTIWRIEDRLVPFQVDQRFHAIGSGRDYAIAAMHYGKSAREAVELATLYDIYTAGPITEVRLLEHG